MLLPVVIAIMYAVEEGGDSEEKEKSTSVYQGGGELCPCRRTLHERNTGQKRWHYPHAMGNNVRYMLHMSWLVCLVRWCSWIHPLNSVPNHRDECYQAIHPYVTFVILKYSLIWKCTPQRITVELEVLPHITCFMALRSKGWVQIVDTGKSDATNWLWVFKYIDQLYYTYFFYCDCYTILSSCNVYAPNYASHVFGSWKISGV